VALGLPPLMIDTPWFRGPEVPRCGMLGEHVRLRNAPSCYEASDVCIAMRQAVCVLL